MPLHFDSDNQLDRKSYEQNNNGILGNDQNILIPWDSQLLIESRMCLKIPKYRYGTSQKKRNIGSDCCIQSTV